MADLFNQARNAGFPQPTALPAGAKLFFRRCELRIVNLRTRQELTIKDARIRFNIEKQDQGEPNKGTIEVFNLAERTRNLFTVPPEIKENETIRGLYIELSAGYRDLTRVIHTGDASSQSYFSSPDWITKLETQDGGSAIRNSVFSRSYRAGFPINQAIRDVIDSFGLARGYTIPSVSTARIQSGLALGGKSADAMNQFAKDFGFKWSVQNNTINTWFPRGVVGPIVNLTPNSGLIGSPIKTDKGVNFDCFLIPLIQPGVTVRISGCQGFNGDVVVQRQKIVGDVDGGEWKIQNEGIQP